MTDPTTILMASSAALVGVAIASAATLRAWSGWLELKRLELDTGRYRRPARSAGRPDIAELKHRVRKLEAIASGIEI